MKKYIVVIFLAAALSACSTGKVYWLKEDAYHGEFESAQSTCLRHARQAVYDVAVSKNFRIIDGRVATSISNNVSNFQHKIDYSIFHECMNSFGWHLGRQTRVIVLQNQGPNAYLPNGPND